MNKKIQIKKRNGFMVDFDQSKVIGAIERAMMETDKGVDEKISHEIAQEIIEILTSREITRNPYAEICVGEVEEIQDWIENLLAKKGRFDVSKRYILYREERSKVREHKVKEEGLLTEEFLSKYKHTKPPMTQLGELVYYRTYSRYLEKEQRREYWWETVRRAVEYNCSLIKTSRAEAEKLFDNIFNLRQFLSGRTFWIGGTDVAYKYPMANYNCSLQVIDDYEAFRDVFYVLMIGSGAGIRAKKEDVAKLPPIRTNVNILHLAYDPVDPKDRTDSTSLIFYGDFAKIVVGDSKEGWVQALDMYLSLLWKSEYKNIEAITFDYSNVRPKGERLKTFGGTASGHEALMTMFKKIDKIIKQGNSVLGWKKLKPVDAMDIANIIGEGVVVGGVRRTSEVVLFSPSDKEIAEAKSNLYRQVDGEWQINESLIHRQMSNNSTFYESKPAREQWRSHIQEMRYSGEPGFINAEAAKKRRPNFHGGNPLTT